MTPRSPMSFRDGLAVSASLKIAGQTYAFTGGAVREFQLDARSYGFGGVVEIVVQHDKPRGGGFEDTLQTPFLTTDLVEIDLEIGVVHDHPETDEALKPIAVSGIVTAKTVTEVPYAEIADRPVLVRVYRLRFVDPARAVWRRHFPCKLYTDKTPQNVIDDHKGDKVKISYDWSEATASKPQWFVHLPLDGEASFYDFVLWWVDARAGVFAYDYTKKQYAITASKDASAAPLPLIGDDVVRSTMVIPEPPRHVLVVNNSYATATRTETVEQDKKLTGVRHDLLIRTTISQDVDDRVTLEKSRLAQPKYQASIEFGRMPSVDMLPGTRLKVLAANRWNKDSALVTPTWRVLEFRISGRASDSTDDRDAQEASTTYAVEAGARLEQSDDPCPVLPDFVTPGYPGFVEGKVVSDKGEDGDKTYQTFRDDATSTDEYTVEIPLWESQKVTAQFIPSQGSGNVYVPSYREERVLMALWLERAEIAQLLEWREGAALSMDVQGEQILLGKNTTSNTSVNHVYEDDQPVFNVARTNDKDTSVITLSEGTLLMKVEEQAG